MVAVTVTVIVTAAVMEVVIVHHGPHAALAMVLSPRWCRRPVACCPSPGRPGPDPEHSLYPSYDPADYLTEPLNDS
jgi:hypothetical protein